MPTTRHRVRMHTVGDKSYQRLIMVGNGTAWTRCIYVEKELRDMVYSIWVHPWIDENGKHVKTMAPPNWENMKDTADHTLEYCLC